MERRPWHARYDTGVPASIVYEPLTLAGNLLRAAERWPDRTALCFGNARLDYARLARDVARLASALHRLGIGKGTSVAVHLPNLPQTAVAFYAVQACGARAVMTNPLYTPRELEHQWTDAGCEVAITADVLYARHAEALRGRVPVREWIVASVPEYLRPPLRWLAPWKLRRRQPPAVAAVPAAPHVHRFRDLVRRTPGAPPRPQVDLDDVAVLQYTGGTTGVSKAAMLTHRNLMANVQQCRAWMADFRDGEEVFLGALPYFHIFGLTVCLNLPVYLGATIVVQTDPRDVAVLLAALQRQRVSLFAAVPTLLLGLLSAPGIERADLRSLRGVLSGSAPLPLDTQRRFEELTGAVVFEGFGLTEASPATHLNPLSGERRSGTVGLPLPDTDCRLVALDESRQDVPPGAEGELWVRGPQVMLGYWKRPDETAKVLADGWLSTGDLARMDEDGYFRIVGRKKDMILVSGYNVFPDEVDQVLSDHPAVREACTIGVPDARRGETVKSFVVLEPGAQVTEEALLAHCRLQLAAYKVPRQLEFRQELPRSSMMKLLRRELREQEIARRPEAPEGVE